MSFSLSERQRKALSRIVGESHVLWREEDLLVYECDAYTLEKHLPTAVVLPGDPREVREVVRFCATEGLPIIPRGAGTSLSGSVAAVGGGVVVSLSRMRRILSIDPRNRRALVEAGCVNLHLTQAASRYGLVFAPDPSSQGACTIGGNVATNSGGPHTLRYGVTTNHVLGLELVLSDGQTVWLGVRPEEGDDAPGLDLRGVVIGSEGMLGIVTQVLVRLIPPPPARKTLLVAFPSVTEASRAVSAIIEAGIVPGALEMMDELIIRAVEATYQFGFPQGAGAVLIIELEGVPSGLDRLAAKVEDLCRKANACEVRVATTEKERNHLWKARKGAFGAVGRISPNYLTQDGVVPRSHLAEITGWIEACSKKYGVTIGNVFHAGDGNIHPLILYDEQDPDQVRRALAAGREILERCLELGGSVTGEHGIGLEKMDLLEKQFGAAELALMQALRRAFDPQGRCNPYKMFPSSRRCADFFPRRQIAA
ncbi:FAD-binding oxidoreductase [Candidatus Methylacidithermus pantelleriae]|nr:FAD-linked oxidase C-terminal domain-containing protein [Candidatus Methylacidithermus pantelleriae]